MRFACPVSFCYYGVVLWLPVMTGPGMMHTRKEVGLACTWPSV